MRTHKARPNARARPRLLYRGNHFPLCRTVAFDVALGRREARVPATRRPRSARDVSGRTPGNGTRADVGNAGNPGALVRRLSRRGPQMHGAKVPVLALAHGQGPLAEEAVSRANDATMPKNRDSKRIDAASSLLPRRDRGADSAAGGAEMPAEPRGCELRPLFWCGRQQRSAR
jgi:hypothetical protein